MSELFLPCHRLVGDVEENFYQLGLKDRDRHRMLLDHATGLFRSRYPAINRVLQEILKAAMIPALELHPRYKKRIEAYAEGLGRSSGEISMALMVPEMMSFLNKWVPGIPHTALGCSSTFVFDEKRETMVHGRTLDFPFLGSFDAEERILQTTFEDGPVTVSFSSAGFPYPAITAMTAHGVTLAMHQKFGDTFYYQGTPIFDLVFELLQNCDSREEAIRFLKKQKSITSWALYMGFQDGKVLSAELDGDQCYYSVHHVVPGKLLYFCNVREKEQLISHEVLPYGFQSYNEMRIRMKEQKLKKLGFNKGKGWSAEKLLRFMGTAWEQDQVPSPKWQADPMTPSTLQNICLIPETEEALLIAGPAPKFFNGEAVHLTDAFSSPQQKILNIRGQGNSASYQKGVFHYMKSQVYQDLGDYHNSYHHIQLAIDYFKGNPYETIARFFFLVFQYMHETHKKALSQILQDFKSLDDRLPPYLQDHNSLFIARLEKILKGQTTVGIDEIQHPSLQRVFDFEQKMPRLLFHKVTRELMAPRLELLDIIYPHVKP